MGEESFIFALMSFVYLRLSSSDSYSKSRSTLVTRAIARRYTTAPATRNNAATNACIGFKTIVLIHRKKIAQQNTTGAGRKTLYGLCNCGSRRLNTRTPSTVMRYQPQSMMPLKVSNPLKLPTIIMKEVRAPCSSKARAGVERLECNCPKISGR